MSTGPTDTAEPSDLSQPKPDEASLALLGSTLLQVLGGFFSLARLELGQAIKAVPQIIAVTCVAVLLSIFAWIALSMSVGWIVYHFTGYSVLAPVSVLALHILALAGCWMLKRRLGSRLSFPYTRDEWRHIKELVHEASQKTT
jgi:uncharacterized membrane protein YqjE